RRGRGRRRTPPTRMRRSRWPATAAPVPAATASPRRAVPAARAAAPTDAGIGTYGWTWTAFRGGDGGRIPAGGPPSRARAGGRRRRLDSAPEGAGGPRPIEGERMGAGKVCLALCLAALALPAAA